MKSAAAHLHGRATRAVGSSGLAWICGLALAHGGATWLLAGAARTRLGQGQALEAAGILAVPAGAALEALASPLGPLVAALFFTLSVGLLCCLLANCAADLLQGRRVIWRILPVLFVAAVATALAVRNGHAWHWPWLAAVLVVPYAIRVSAWPRDQPPRPFRPGFTWLGALLLLLPLAFAVGPDLFRDARTVLVSLPGGGHAINAYYRHALLAAEPVKPVSQRLFLTYSTAGPGGDPPDWLRCRSRPWPLLPLGGGEHADLRFEASADERIYLRTRAARTPLTPDNAEDVLSAHAEARDAPSFRAFVAIGVLAGLPGLLAWWLARALQRLAAGRRVLTLIACMIVGALLALGAGWLEPPAAEPDAEGTPAQRLAAATSVETPPAQLRRLAADDPLLPVRAWALAERIRRAPDPAAMATTVAAASTWYEQWHGYRALLTRDWHPNQAACA